MTFICAKGVFVLLLGENSTNSNSGRFRQEALAPSTFTFPFFSFFLTYMKAWMTEAHFKTHQSPAHPDE